MPGPFVYHCGVDDPPLDVTRQVLAACAEEPVSAVAAGSEKDNRTVGPNASGDRPRTVRVQCRNQHWCDYPCNPPADTPSPIVGTPISPDEITRWSSLLSYTDPQQGLERTEKYAKWVLGASGTVATLLAGLAAGNAFQIDGRYERLAYGAVIVLLGGSWAAASWSLAPRWTRVHRSSPDSTIRGLGTLLDRRRGALLAAAVLFGLALLVAGMVPLADAIPDPVNPRASVAYTVHHPGDSLTAALVGAGLSPESPVEVSIRPARGLAGLSVGGRAVVDSAGRGKAMVTVDIDTVAALLVTGRWVEDGSRGREWRQDTVTVDVRKLPAARRRADAPGDSASTAQQ